MLVDVVARPVAAGVEAHDLRGRKQFLLFVGVEVVGLEPADPVIHELPGVVAEQRRELGVAVIREVAAGLIQLDPADVRRNIAHVAQDVLLFHGSLRDNIAFGLPHVDDAAIVAAAEVAVGLALIVALYRKRQSAHTEDLTHLKF